MLQEHHAIAQHPMPQQEGRMLKVDHGKLPVYERLSGRAFDLMQHSSAIRLDVNREKHADVRV
jgi:hypothetical protein